MGILDKLKDAAFGKKTVTVKTKATGTNIAQMKDLLARGAKIKGISYTSPDGEVKRFKNVKDLEAYTAKVDELDLNSIGDELAEPPTVYDDGKPRNKDRCPNCGHKFSPAPTRGRKCPECKLPFVVRSGNRLFNSNLLNPDDGAAADCFSNMSYLGVSVAYGKKILASRRKSFPATEPASRDVIWDIMRKYPTTLADKPEDMLDTAAELHRLVAMYEDDCGRDPRPLLKGYIRQNIEHCRLLLKIEGREQEHLYVMSDYCCEVCKERHGKSVKISVAKEKMPIPFKDCQNRLSAKSKYPFCRAYYSWFDPRDL